MNATDLPDIARARLPVNYSSACTALAECNRIDECKEWANKAEALASYARQAKDETLRKTADRIQARAVQRCGALLREIPDTNRGRPSEIRTGTDINLTRAQAATDAGLSKRQKDTALQVSNVEPALFEAQVESDNPPTVTELAEQGKQKKPQPLVDLGDVDPADFQATTQAVGWAHQMRHIVESRDLSPKKIIRGFLPDDKRLLEFSADLDVLLEWIDELQVLIYKETK